MTEKIGGYPRPSVESKPTGAQAPKRPDDSARAEKSPSATAEPSGRDAVRLTETATRLQSIEARLKDMSDIDRDRVETLRTLIESGDYEINAKQIARKLAELERLLY
jgi:flagellar biosynthesis anti-sigma factor FlgM